jgi:hypothetical protein
MYKYFKEIIKPLSDELTAFIEKPYVCIEENVITECDTCAFKLHPVDALWGFNDQPYCSKSCAQFKGQLFANDQHYLISPVLPND